MHTKVGMLTLFGPLQTSGGRKGHISNLKLNSENRKKDDHHIAYMDPQEEQSINTDGNIKSSDIQLPRHVCPTKYKSSICIADNCKLLSFFPWKIL